MGEIFPRRFGRYTLIEHLAQGGMGSLYLAYQGEVGFEKLCVVKTVLRELADKEYLARFRDEAKVVVRLSHGNLVPVFDAGAVDGELYIVMDYVDGRDLRAVWNRCADKLMPFPVDVAVYLIKELCRGLHHAHTLGDLKLVHRDVSPPNVLLAYSGEVKLTDFGLANSALKLQHTMPGIIYGKVSYMSPEQARGETLDGRADVYAAGVILWELLTGRQLFPNTDGAAIERVRSPEVPRPSMKAARVPLALDALVMKALAPEPANRFPDAESFRAALASYLAKEAPTIDTARVAAFLKQLFEDEIERDRRHRETLVAESRQKLARPTLEPQQSRVAPPPQQPSGRSRPAPVAVALSPSMKSAMSAAGVAAESYDQRGDGDGSGDDEIEEASELSLGLIGALIDGRYRVDRLIGEGGMGRVYEAEHVEIGKRVAIKVLHPNWSRFPELVARFRREARAASRIGHPNIIDVTDSGTTPSGAVYIVMELLEGADLAEVIEREKALAVDRAIHIAVQLARALQAAHAAGVVHRDLKPENVFLVARPGHPDFVKVLDFGIARNLEGETGKPRLTQPNMAMGTPQYMAPEQAAGRPADARSDVYGVGAIVYEMLVGRPPHTGDNPEAVLHKKLSEVPVPIAELRPDVATALSDCVATTLARDPNMRQQSMAELAEELERFRPDRRRGARAAPPPRSSRRAWVPVASVAGASLLFVAAAGAVWWRSAHPGPVIDAQAALAAEPMQPPVVAALAPTAAGRTPAARRQAPVTDKAAASAERSPAEHKESAHTEPRRASTPPPLPAPRPAPARSPSGTTDGKRALDEANRLLREHQITQAERAFQRLLDGNVEKGAAATGLARAAFESGHYSDAVRRGERAVQLGGGVPARKVLGDAYLRQERFQEAARQYRALLKQKPDDADAKKHLQAALAAGG